MITTLPLPNSYFKNSYLLVIVILLICNTSFSQSKKLATSIITESHVENAVNATLDDNTFATLNSNSGLILGAGKEVGILELKYSDDIAANTISYVQLDFEEDLLNLLIQGSLGKSLVDIAGNVLFGDHYFEIIASYNSNVITSGSTSTFSNSNNFKIVADAQGEFYAAIKPFNLYNSIRIEDHSSALLG